MDGKTLGKVGMSAMAAGGAVYVVLVFGHIQAGIILGSITFGLIGLGFAVMIAAVCVQRR
jgi:hypothetical protein